MAGKTLKSSAFVSEPSTIEYIDFTPGQRHVLNIKLTNGSLTFNNFKLLPMADEVTDFFEITYTKPGRMSAGTSCMLEIAFTPQVNEDIFADLWPELSVPEREGMWEVDGRRAQGGRCEGTWANCCAVVGGRCERGGD